METEQNVEIKIRNRSMMQNKMQISFDALSVNEAFARITVAAFVAPLNPTLEELADIKTAVSEAVTNAIIHGYEGEPGQVHMECSMESDVLQVVIKDNGKGILDVEQAMQPLFTTKPEMDRSGMGFSFMEAFMDDLEVESSPGVGTVVSMKKKLGTTSWLGFEE